MKVVLLIKYSDKKIIFRNIQLNFWPPKLTLKTEKVQFLTVLNQKALQDIKKSF